MATKKLNKRYFCLGITVFVIFLLLLFEFWGKNEFFGEISDERLKIGLETTVTRLLGSVVFIILLIYSGFKVLSPVNKGFLGAVIFTLPAFAVAVNNFPIYSLAGGLAWVTSPSWRVMLLALECLAVGLFEETCFRGFIFLSFLEKMRGSKAGQFLAIIYSSAVFAIVHLLNIFVGASPIAVILQIGYSFLIGAMCSVILMKTANIWLCVVTHAVFNFAGALIPTCGTGSIWEPFTVAITVIVSLIVTAFYTYSFFKIKREETDRIYK